MDNLFLFAAKRLSQGQLFDKNDFLQMLPTVESWEAYLREFDVWFLQNYGHQDKRTQYLWKLVFIRSVGAFSQMASAYCDELEEPTTLPLSCPKRFPSLLFGVSVLLTALVTISTRSSESDMEKELADLWNALFWVTARITGIGTMGIKKLFSE